MVYLSNAVSFDILKGQVLGLVGESGAGKTSIARAITRQLVEPGEITGGKIFFQDTLLIPIFFYL